ncbi:MAG TPA: hypothetical protein VK464_06860 [Symbiobacteriaceae bacterium]|jgi:hypothetical protein|nr:hypothetical protein [Symbiobacteriaceae bacterium]
MSANEERELQQQMAPLGLPDDLTEVALRQGPAPDAAAVARIKARALARAAEASAPTTVRHAPTPHKMRRWPRALAAAAALIALTVVAVPGSRQALARFLQFVPGFGAREAGTARWAAARPVRLERNGAWVEVAGLMAGADSITVNLRTGGVPIDFQNVFVEDGAGHRIPLASGSWSTNSEHTYDGWLTAQGSFTPGGRAVTVVIEGAQPWRVPLNLVPGDQLLGIDQFGPTATVGDYTMAARLTAEADRSRLDVLVRSTREGARVEALGQSVPHRPMTLSTPDWTDLPRPQEAGRSELFQFAAAPLPPGAAEATLTIPAIEVSEPGEGKVTVPAAAGPVDQTVNIGRWSLKLLRTEVAEDQLRVYVEPGGAGPEYLWAFGELKVNGQSGSWSRYHSPETGRLVWFAFQPPQGARSVTLTLGRPQVAVTGPWTITLPVQR